MKRTTIQLDEKLIEKAEEIAEIKFLPRRINSKAEAVREILIEFIKNNKKCLKKKGSGTLQSNNQEAVSTH